MNTDIQYPVTVTREKLRNAFVSWGALNDFISGISNSLYNGAYIDEYRFTKNLVGNAYRTNSVQIQTVSALSDEATRKTFVKALRNAFLDFQEPNSNNNAWIKVGGYGNAVVTWSNPEDIVLLIRNDILTDIDVEVLASAFNMDKTDFMGRVIGVDNFDKYDEDGTKTFDGSAILCLIADKSWFRIKEQDMAMDEFYNANNRSWQMYLNVVKMYNYSCFANAKIIATSAPTVKPTSITLVPSTASVEEDSTVELKAVTVPFQANATITYTSSATGKATVTAKSGDNKTAVVTGVADGSATITATVDNVSGTATITVTDPT